MTDRVVAVFHTECCSSSATAALDAGKAPFITGVDAPRMQQQQLLCKKNVLVQSADNMLHLQQQQSMMGVHGSSASSPSTKVLFQLNVRSSKNSESKSKHQRSSSSSASHTHSNSTSVLVADPAAAAVKKKGLENPPTSVNHHLASPATTTKDQQGGSSGKVKEKDQQQQQKQQQQQFLGAALLLNSPDEYERMLMNLIDQLHGICLHALALERWHAPQLKNVHRRYQESARNLLHYVAFRSLDIAGLQETLTSLGLSSLDNCEASTIASVNSVISSVRSLLYAAQLDSSHFLELSWPLAADQAGNNLFSNAQELFGPFSSQRETHIMVTLPSESALEEDTLIQTLIKAGMNVARVNCAHDGPETWLKMIRKVRYFSQLLESPCRVMMDLAGPKLRTGPMRPGPSVLKLKPFKDETGEVTSPATVWIANEGVKPPPSPAASEEEDNNSRVVNANIPITEEAQKWLKKIAVGDIFKFKDRKGRQRELLVVAKAGAGVWAECNDTSYVETATEFVVVGSRGAKKARLHVGELPKIEQAIVLRAGDKLVLTRDNNLLGTPAVLDKTGNVVAPARIACTLEQVFEAAKADDPIKFDEGKITGRISAVSSSEILVEITDAGGDQKGRKLRGEKAINLPQTDLAVCGLTAKDATDLEFVAAHADIVALSFVNGPSDVQCLQTELCHIRERHQESSSSSSSQTSLGIVLKIETELGFQRLPALLLQAMEMDNSVGVMVARGDMAVECGWQRLAEMQDQILITCEAAHVPTIWATQVLEGMAKSGIPSRAEITDAASASRAECVMLNKGPHIIEAVNSLNDILHREAFHRRKNHAIMHPLSQFQNYH
ncbi:unnamed protein product [Sphagnum troendelagicum]|uniref:pyruvate kinase n=1 Tax=Sphagnum troendelagicum TaxID=128251 RepID=A0ABP0V2P7_9BRYO